MNFNLVSRKKRDYVLLSGNSVPVVNKNNRKKRTASHYAQPTNNDARVDESEGLRCRVRAAASLFFSLVAQDRKLSLSGCLGWAEEAPKRHVRAEQQR